MESILEKDSVPSQQRPLMSSLFPITPSRTERYASKTSAPQARNVVVPAGLFTFTNGSEVLSLPQGWSAHIQPEGQIYFASDSKPRVVTDAYMYSPLVRDRVLYFAGIVSKILVEKSISLPDSAEVYLKPFDGLDVSGYYLVDHASHTAFWLSPLSLDDLALEDVVSESHLRLELEEQYWNHLEQFPSHRFDSLHLAIDELISVFLHGECDQRTSQGSTFPYTAKQTRYYLRILQDCKENLRNAHTVCSVARLWSAITRVRAQMRYGQEHARLDRNQHLFDVSLMKRGRIFGALSRVMFGVPEVYAKTIESLYVDGVAFQGTWYDFMSTSQDEWKQYLTWTIGVTIINILLLVVPGTSGRLASVSLACCALAAIASLTLLRRFHNGAGSDFTSNAVLFCETAKANANQREALTLSLPRAMSYWAVALTAGQGLVFIERATNVYVLGALVALVILVSLPWGKWYDNAASVLPRWRREARAADCCDDVASNLV